MQSTRWLKQRYHHLAQLKGMPMPSANWGPGLPWDKEDDDKLIQAVKAARPRQGWRGVLIAFHAAEPKTRRSEVG